MTIRIGSNIASLSAQRRLSEADSALSKTFERLSSGQRINRASDDAAVLAIASELDANQRIFQQGIRNLNDGISVLNIADQALGELTSIIQRQNELAEQSANGVYSVKQRASLDIEAQALADEYQRILESTEFNGMKLLDGSNPGIVLQAGKGEDSVLDLSILGTVSTEGTPTLQGLGTYSNQNVGIIFDNLSTLLVGDFNEDGIDDIASLGIAILGASFEFGVEIIEGQESGSFAVDHSTSDTIAYLPLYGGYAYYEVWGRVTDRDFDGHLDIEASGNVVEYVTYTINSRIGTFYGDGTGVTNFTNNLPGFTDETSNLVFGDFNGDGFGDRASVSGSTVGIQIQDVGLVESTTTAVQSLSLDSFSLLTQSDAREALTTLSQSLQTVQEVRSNVGASLSRVGTAVNTLGATVENIALAVGRMRDADIALESSNVLTFQIRQNITAAILSQANQQPALALRLLSTGPP